MAVSTRLLGVLLAADCARAAHCAVLSCGASCAPLSVLYDTHGLVDAVVSLKRTLATSQFALTTRAWQQDRARAAVWALLCAPLQLKNAAGVLAIVWRNTSGS